MQNILSDYLEYIWGVWRFKWTALAIAWCIAIIGWLFVSQMPDQYEAKARIQIDTNQVLGPLLKGLAIQPNVQQRISLLSRSLLNRPNLEKLLRMTDLDLKVKDELEKEKYINLLAKKISLRGDRGNKALYTVSYIDQDRLIAKRIVQSVLTIFIESSLGKERKESEDASSFIEQQIAEYEVRLRAAEERLAQFKRTNSASMPNEIGGYFQRLDAVKENLKVAKLESKQANVRRKAIQKQLALQQPSLQNPALVASSFDARIEKNQDQLDALLLRFTNKHPDVIQLKLLISDLQVKAAEEVSGMSHSISNSANPIYQELTPMLAEAEALAAESAIRVKQYHEDVISLEEKVDNIPQIEAKLLQLDRDYSVLQKQYDTLTARRESARISGKAEENVDDVKFKIIDPPFVPIEPIGPKRVLFNIAVLILGLGVGIGGALLLSLVHSVFSSKQTLARVSGLPVLGAVGFALSPDAHKIAKMKLTVFVAGTSSLVVALIVVLFFNGIFERLKELAVAIL